MPYFIATIRNCKHEIGIDLFSSLGCLCWIVLMIMPRDLGWFLGWIFFAQIIFANHKPKRIQVMSLEHCFLQQLWKFFQQSPLGGLLQVGELEQVQVYVGAKITFQQQETNKCK